MPQKLLPLPFFFHALTAAILSSPSLKFSPSRYLLNKPQKVQNSTVCFVLKVPHTDHVSPCLASLLRLSIYNEYSTNSILCTLYYNCLNSTAFGYLTELLKVYRSTCQLCSSSYKKRNSTTRMTGSILTFHSSFCAHALTSSNIPFLMLHFLSGTVSLAKLDYQTRSNLSNHL